jgi:hypothetical protein
MHCSWRINDTVALKKTSAIPQLSAVSGQFHYFLVPFPQLRMVLKINQKNILEPSVSLETKFAVKGQ